MVADPELESYVQQMAAQGRTHEQIRKNLLQVGWDARKVDQALASRASVRDPAGRASSVAAEAGNAVEPENVEILRKAFSFMRDESPFWLPYFAVGAAAQVASMVILRVATGTMFSTAGGGAMAAPTPRLAATLFLAVIMSLLLGLFTFAVNMGLTKGVSERLEGKAVSVGEGLTVGFSLLLSAMWLGLLASLFILGGLILLIIPGIYLAVRYSLITPALVLDGKRGREAMKASGELIDGRWWKTLELILLTGLVGLAGVVLLVWPVGLIGTFILNGPTSFSWNLVSLVWNGVVYTLSTTFSVVVLVMYYRALRAAPRKA